MAKSKKKKAVVLGPKEWIEIYYALDGKAHSITRGDYGEDGEDDVDNDEWAGHLREIMREIGPDGKRAAKHGVAPSL